jgi:nicotinamide mononucleotide transporter
MQIINNFINQSKQYFSGWDACSAKTFFNDWNILEISWLVIATLIILVISIISGDLGLALVVALTGIWNNILIAKGKVVNYIFGVINNALYAYISFTTQIYGQAILFILYFLPMQFYGWYLWTSSNNQEQFEIVTKTLNWVKRFLLVVLVIVASLIYGLILHLFGEIVAWTDALATVVSILAMLLMAKLYIEQWACWIIINIVSVILWLEVIFKQGTNDYSILAMWLVFLINAIYGFMHWMKLYKKGE